MQSATRIARRLLPQKPLRIHSLNSFGPLFLGKCLGSNRKHIEGGYCYVEKLECAHGHPKLGGAVTVVTGAYFGDNKGIAGATGTTLPWGQRQRLVRESTTSRTRGGEVEARMGETRMERKEVSHFSWGGFRRN
ncbi:hypothetical protein ABEB36_013549 [Hypothenemus hampei]|uniref:Uncharacterized protein n=1 Tax=Hypothenemus hampei TaxID=57062 RepID=A0ABD1E4V5_HYPHA